MARRKRTAKTDIERAKKFAKLLGMDPDKLLSEIPVTEIGHEAAVRHSIEAESVLFYIETKGKGFQQKTCKWCGGLFLHTYFAVAYCSDECRASALAEHGIIWNFDRKRDSERWNCHGKGYVPKVIGVEATQALIDAGYVVPEQREVTEETTDAKD